MHKSSELNRKARLSEEHETWPDDIERHYDAQGHLIKASANQYGGISDWLYGEEWEKARAKKCPKCGRPKPLSAKQKALIKRHVLKVAIRTGLIMGLLALAFGLHSSWREGMAFGLMDLAVGPITDNLWEIV